MSKYSRSSPAVQVVMERVTRQVEQIRSQDGPVRQDAPDSVHAMRVAARRLRSALQTFSRLFDKAATRPVRDELKWLGGVLGEARDAEVFRDRVIGVVETHLGGRLGEGGEEVRAELEGGYRAAHDRVLNELDSPRYRALLESLAALVEQPPLRGRAHRRADKVLPRLVARTYSAVASAMEVAAAAPPGDARAELLHEARKKAKRARYAGETVAPTFGKKAERFAAAMEALQDALGEHLDARNAGERVADLASRTSRPGTAFEYGRLHALEEVRAQRARDDVDAAWSAARRRRLRRWLP
ncbi:CHAD domain-containing protein [Antribacter sp. KLBMP9083]|uniref:CHAD domain-containing protein n=1 Tax=Antribacter soli TaxID=2910976 RepID=A0AA41U7B7_9MICO|nr:CHAD domain-containing protein [Antribacter soli]MCF4121888.1 CHAD domain-containing protein [Antribacter soli]